LTGPETNTGLNIHTNMSTIPDNLAKIGLVVFEIPLQQAIGKEEERIGKKLTAA